MAININNVTVEVGLNQSPSTAAASLTWTDITSSVILSEGINYTTGKSFADRVARPGTMTLTLDNSAQKGTAGRFTVGGPNCLSGFNLRIPIRIYYDDGTNTADLWYGFIDLLSSRWQNGVRPVVQVTASDRLSRLARINIGNRYTDEILSDSPAGYWPLDDQGGEISLNRGSYPFGAMRKFAYTYFTDGDGSILLGVDPATKMGADSPKVAYAATSPSGNGKYLSASAPDPWDSSGHFTETFEVMVNPSKTDGGLFTVGGARDQHLASVSAYMVGGALRMSVVVFPGAYSASAQQFNVTSAQSVFTADKWHHVAITQTSTTGPNSTTLNGYVNGVQVCTLTFSLTGYASPTQFMSSNGVLVVGGYVEPVSTGGAYELLIQQLFNGYISNFAYYTSVLSDTRIAEHAKLINGFSNESSSARFNRLCKFAGLPSGYYASVGRLTPTSVGTARASSTMSAQPLLDNGTGRNFLSLIQEVADSEQGDIFSYNNSLIFVTRNGRYNPTTSWSVPAQAINADNGFDYDHTDIVNTARLTNGDGTVVTSSDATSVSNYDVQSIDTNCYVNTTGQLEAIAYGLAHRSSSPQPRLRNITVDFVTWPSTASSTPLTVMQSYITSVFEVTGLPSSTSPTSTLRLFIEGFSDRITESTWQRTFTASPVTAAFDPVWNLGTSVLGTSTILAM